ncbi:ABC transporter ATP-binding protein [Cnuella takakiae]|nr:ABC transporter ATP-binding protein [Cnuella takakiae]OLY92026.1 hypothetical protein BUE76_09045 [Cnuella takakiae]
MSLLQVSDLHINAATGPVLRGISFETEALKNIAIAGATGSGKSTLLKAIGGLAQPTSGKILFGGKRVLGPDERLLPGHPQIAYLSQHFELRNNYRVEEELECLNQMSEGEAARIYAICEVDHLLKRRTDQLSGGEKQRIVTARLLTTRPKLLLLDEPFSNLDLAHKQVMQRVINEISTQLEITCMLVTHDPQDSLPWAHHILIMRDGLVVQEGTPQALYHHPVDAYAAGLLGKYNELSTTQADALGMQKNHFLLRPEAIQIHSSGKGPQATVEAVLFYGSYYETRLRYLDGSLLVRTLHAEWKPGDQLFISLTA